MGFIDLLCRTSLDTPLEVPEGRARQRVVRAFSDILGHPGNGCALQIHSALTGHFFLPSVPRTPRAMMVKGRLHRQANPLPCLLVLSRGCVPRSTHAGLQCVYLHLCLFVPLRWSTQESVSVYLWYALCACVCTSVHSCSLSHTHACLEISRDAGLEATSLSWAHIYHLGSQSE